MYERKFVDMATAEGGSGGDDDLCFGIYQGANNKAELLDAGDYFLRNFEAHLQEEIKRARENDGVGLKKERIDEFNELIDQSKLIDRDVFIKLLDEQWEAKEEAR